MANSTPDSVRTIARKVGVIKNTKFELFEGEVFKQVKTKDLSHYEVSNYGRIRNQLGQLLKSAPHHQSGYIQTRLVDANGKKVTKINHVLEAETFLDKPVEDGYTVDHIDRNRQNNYIGNLRYATIFEQAKNNKRKKGYKLLTEEQARKCCELLSAGYSISKIVEYDPTVYTKAKVERIRARNRWTDVSKDYQW